MEVRCKICDGPLQAKTVLLIPVTIVLTSRVVDYNDQKIQEIADTYFDSLDLTDLECRWCDWKESI